MRGRTIFSFLLVVVVLAPPLAALQLEDAIPQPRAPLIPKITSVDQLVPFAKIIVQNDYIGQRHGWSIRGGERVRNDESREYKA